MSRRVLYPFVIVLAVLTVIALLGAAQMFYPYEASSNQPEATEYVLPTSTPIPVATPIPDNAVFYLKNRLTGVAEAKCLVHLSLLGQSRSGWSFGTNDYDTLSDHNGRISWMLGVGYYAFKLDCPGFGSQASSVPYIFNVDATGSVYMEDTRGGFCPENQPIILAITMPAGGPPMGGPTTQASVEVCKDFTLPTTHVVQTPGVT